MDLSLALCYLCLLPYLTEHYFSCHRSLMPVLPALLTLWQHVSVRNRWFGGLVLAVVVAAVALAEGLMANAGKTFSGGKELQDILGPNDTGIALLGNVYDIDIPSRIVSISWLIVGCGELMFPNSSGVYSPYCGRLSTTTDFYADGSANATATYDASQNPVDPRTGVPVFVQGIHTFQTQELLVLYAWKGLDQQFAYPFDGYQMETSFIARNSDTQEILPILAIRIVSSTDNMDTKIRFDIPTNTRNATSGEAIPARTMEMAFARNGFTKAFVVTLWIVNWALTAVCAYITISACVGVEVTEGILVLPVSVILTIPSLRALWIGAPGFGLLLDACGTFLQMVIVSFCSVFLVIAVGVHKQKKAEAEQSKKLHDIENEQATRAHSMGRPEASRSPSEKGAATVRTIQVPSLPQ
ncbi:hypothetical protein K474DRAFT_1767480 [Panus rudis PR-1116 ss-1]|nr:hypothetical protein K474DRAFT_1767480 [Panus rudis PR-1116 ss-1]